jgi:LCP family protein required for cell wall assembly
MTDRPPAGGRYRRITRVRRAGRPGPPQWPGPPRRPARPPLTRRGKIWMWIASVATSLVVLAGLAAYAIYAHLDGNLTVTNAFAGLRNRPAAAPPGVENILVLGSQTRDGQAKEGGPGFGYDPNTNLSDNLILVHLDATHTHATVVSIPRDTLVYEPACKARLGHGTVPAQQQAIIDGAMNLGGPPCAVATVEHLTGIRMTHFIEFDFNSFRTMVRVVGGVEVCLRQAVHDPYSGLNLSAGRHLINGNRALEFVRTRHGVGDGSDLGRIELQQQFMSSLIQKITSQGVLGNPVKLLQIADTATKALTVDPGLGSVAKLIGLGDSLRGLRTSHVTFITMPTILDPANIDRLLPQEPEDDTLWQMLKTGKLWRGHLPVPAPRRVGLVVDNGTGIAHLARQTATRLRKLGFNVVRVGNAAAAATTTITYPGTGAAGGAYALAQDLTTTPAAQSAGSAGPITLTLGSDFGSVVKPAPPGKAGHSRHRHTSSTGGQAALETRNAAQNICSGVPAANPYP